MSEERSSAFALQELHRARYQRRLLTRQVFDEIRRMARNADDTLLSGPGLRIELGAGVAPMRDIFPDVLSTDVIDGPKIDKVVDATKMSLENNSVRVFYGQNCFHHFPDPDGFFSECRRCLHSGGGVVLIEPHFGPFASLVYPLLFKSEVFDKAAESWRTEMASNMEGANQALSYIVFKRDREIFERKYPELHLVRMEPLENWLRYIGSGGLNFPQLIPNALAPAAAVVERGLRGARGILALHHLIVIRKQ